MFVVTTSVVSFMFVVTTSVVIFHVQRPDFSRYLSGLRWRSPVGVGRVRG
ncbi:hypothetical protein NG799_09845 [Laspinema sp. D1]|uniref:Uncharacterized protein n=1 Tax=Laspinema palackyanum D2a TaxID=2953684 RepID=A0ABT2MPJ8_9CYAN|nr:hypothetical protein [Laspinema sp. D2a]